MPTFKHDCDCCEFIGQHATKEGALFDLYHCIQGGFGATYVARFSNEGADYTSMNAESIKLFIEANKANAETLAAHPLYTAYYLRKARANYSHSTGLKLGALNALL